MTCGIECESDQKSRNETKKALNYTTKHGVESEFSQESNHENS